MEPREVYKGDESDGVLKQTYLKETIDDIKQHVAFATRSSARNAINEYIFGKLTE